MILYLALLKLTIFMDLVNLAFVKTIVPLITSSHCVSSLKRLKLINERFIVVLLTFKRPLILFLNIYSKDYWIRGSWHYILTYLVRYKLVPTYLILSIALFAINKVALSHLLCLRSILMILNNWSLTPWAPIWVVWCMVPLSPFCSSHITSFYYLIQ